MKLLIFKCDYSDEFDVYGFEVVTDETWEKYKETIQNMKYPHEVYFGTNEELIFEDVNDYMRNIKVKDISEAEAEVFGKFFRNYGKTSSFGFTPF